MYRHSAALNIGAKTHGFLAPSPARDDQSASESESETVAELDRKRRQLDEEIAHFKTQKEKEFRDFEQDLRRKRKRKRSPANSDNHIARTPPTDPSVLSLLGSRPQANGHANKQSQQYGSRLKPVPSKPTLSVEKLTIVGTNAPPTTADARPSVLARPLTNTTTTTLHTQNEKPPILAPTANTQNNIKQEPPLTPIARDHNDHFAGVFTPAYLPLLDSRSSTTHSTPQVQPQDQLSHSDPAPQTPQPGSESSSLPSSPISPRIPNPAKRSYTSPLLSSASLPSALRATSADTSSTKKRKHVTFRLADSAVVEPSSSYEEVSSPDLPLEATKGTLKNGKAKSNGIDAVLSTEEVPWSWSKGPTSPIVEKEDGMNLVGDGEEDEEPPTIKTNGAITSDHSPPPGLSFDEAPDGGSGVGFFELEEELQSPSPSSGISPRMRSPRSDRSRFFDDWGALPDEDVEMADDQRTAEARGVETHTTERDLAAEMEVDADDEMEARGLGISTAAGKGNGEGSTFASGSVPIDIVVRPSSSWVGSLGAGSLGKSKESEYVP